MVVSKIKYLDLEEAAKPLDEYASLREFFVRTLKEGSRPIDSNPCCLISPVDGTIIRFGELKGAGSMIEQVKGFSYFVSSLLGASPFLLVIAEEDIQQDSKGQEIIPRDENKKSWWRTMNHGHLIYTLDFHCSLTMGLFYCVIYLKPGDYHRIHSPVDWNVLVRRHFSGWLFPLNERAARTIRNLYVENEKVCRWQESFMVMAAIGATTIGSIEVKSPISKSLEDDSATSKFRFCIRRGDRIHVGEALGRWHDS
ncbi:hypothetical protein LOK49_LG06G01308 [Camellia lanceoleosa]|uniref:Uncharacterized protein n=1 Tax=Camellia lanceoleosa TaxID=1840588 RepID=A0ACC0HF85_9ERIC|nr:hypothetical protein LOK49_LG06G01308 [Camellia lanceoleosa]